MVYIMKKFPPIHYLTYLSIYCVTEHLRSTLSKIQLYNTVLSTEKSPLNTDGPCDFPAFRWYKSSMQSLETMF